MVLRGLTVGLCLWLIAAPALAALGKNEIRELEGLLAGLGFDPGPVDGVMDARTGTAIKDYQDFAALPVTGQASWPLLDELRGVTESLDDVRIPESAPQAVAGPEAVKSQEKVTEPAFAAPKPAGPKPTAPKKAPVETAAVQTEAPAAVTAPVSTSPAAFEIALQLARFRSEAGARRGWAQMQQQLPNLLGGMSPQFPAVDLGEEGIYYRVLTGPFPNRATAADLCAMMTVEGQECRVIQSAPAPAPLQLAEAEISAPSPESEAPPAKKAGLAPPFAPALIAPPPEPAPEVQGSAGVKVTGPVLEEVAASPEEMPKQAVQTPTPAATAFKWSRLAGPRTFPSPNASDAPLSQGDLARTVGLVGDLGFFFSKLADTDPNPLARQTWRVAAQAYTAGEGALDAALQQGRLQLSDEALEQAIQRREDGWLVFANLATHLIGAWVDEEWAQGEAWFQRHETAAGLGTSAAEGRPRRADLARYWVFKDILLRASLFRAATESPSQGGLWSVRESQIEARLSVFLDRLAADAGLDWTARLRADWAAYRADTNRFASERVWLLLADRRPEPAGLEGTVRWPGRSPPVLANFGNRSRMN